MGAALMSNPDTAVAILEALVKNLSVPVSAKIRCYEDQAKTVDFAKRLANTGISALAIHGRLKVSEKHIVERFSKIFSYFFQIIFNFFKLSLGRKTATSLSLRHNQSSVASALYSSVVKWRFQLFYRLGGHSKIPARNRNQWGFSSSLPCGIQLSFHPKALPKWRYFSKTLNSFNFV